MQARDGPSRIPPGFVVFKTPVAEIELSVTLNFNFGFVTAGSDEADCSFHDLNLRCEPLEIEYDDYMTYYQEMESENELPSVPRCLGTETRRRLEPAWTSGRERVPMFRPYVFYYKATCPSGCIAASQAV
jgi:hypothetical protein